MTEVGTNQDNLFKHIKKHFEETVLLSQHISLLVLQENHCEVIVLLRGEQIFYS